MLTFQRYYWAASLQSCLTGTESRDTNGNNVLLALIHSGMAMGMLTCVYVHPPTPPTPPCTPIVLVRRDFRQRLSCIIEEAVLKARPVQSSLQWTSCSFAAQLDKSGKEIRVIDIVLAYLGIVSQVVACILKRILTIKKKSTWFGWLRMGQNSMEVLCHDAWMPIRICDFYCAEWTQCIHSLFLHL